MNDTATDDTAIYDAGAQRAPECYSEDDFARIVAINMVYSAFIMYWLVSLSAVLFTTKCYRMCAVSPRAERLIEQHARCDLFITLLPIVVMLVLYSMYIESSTVTLLVTVANGVYMLLVGMNLFEPQVRERILEYATTIRGDISIFDFESPARESPASAEADADGSKLEKPFLDVPERA